jgi:hypothetical protein
MKPPRSALPLPRYVERKPLKSGGWGYFFHVPSWAKKAGCTMHSERLGTDYQTAVSRAETLLLPAFDAWRTGSSAPAASSSISTSERSIGFLPNTVLIAATRNSTPSPNAIMKSASSSLAATS